MAIYEVSGRHSYQDSQLYRHWMEDGGVSSTNERVVRRVSALFRLLPRLQKNCERYTETLVQQAIAIANSIRERIGDVTKLGIQSFVGDPVNHKVLKELEKILIEAGVQVSPKRGIQTLLDS